MFSVSIEVEVPNFDHRWLEIDCPICELRCWVTFGQIRRRQTAICRGCHVNIRLEDHLGQYQRFKTKFERLLRSFGK